MKVNKRMDGITLIALVITIIVLLILAGISISMLSGDNSILSQAGRARDITGEKQIEEKVYIALSGALKNGLGTLNYDNLNSEIAKHFNEYEIDPNSNEESWLLTVTENGIEKSYTIKSTGEIQVAAESDIKIKLSIAGEKVTTPPNPDPDVFEHTEGEIDTGYVIRDKNNGNEFVWVPVDKNQKITLKVDSKEDITEIKLYDPVGAEVSVGAVSGKTYNNTNLTPTLNGEYEVVVKTANDVKSKSLVVRSLYAQDAFNDYFSTEEGIEYLISSTYLENKEALIQELKSMNLVTSDNPTDKEIGRAYASDMNQFLDSEDYTESVNNNGGFYVGRYEAGITTQRTSGNSSTDGSTMDVPLSKADVYTYNYVTRSQAKLIAEKMYAEKSHLITGAGWDRTLDWLINTNNKRIKQVIVDSKEWGNYLNSSFTAEGTGSLAKTAAFENNTKANNIYDLAGNVFEWTSMDSTHSGHPCVVRGGGYYGTGSSYPASYRDSINEGYSYVRNGFRVALFL